MLYPKRLSSLVQKKKKNGITLFEHLREEMSEIQQLETE